MDTRYYLYKIKCFLFSDYKYKIVESILNSQEPEIYSRELLKSFKFNKQHENTVRIEFRKLILDAYEKGVPLGSEIGQYQDSEDAYLARQKYLSKFYSKYSVNSDISNLIILLIIASISILLILLFS